MWNIGSSSPSEVDHAGDVVQRVDLAGKRFGPRVEYLVADAQLVLLGWEPVAVDDRLLDGADLADVGQPADRVRVFDQLLVGHRQALVEAPPVGLLLAPVPPQLLAEQPTTRCDALGARRRNLRAVSEP